MENNGILHDAGRSRHFFAKTAKKRKLFLDNDSMQ
jgi:hypothetical protein